MNELGALIKEKRKEKGLTQKRLALEVGVTHQAIGNYEKGSSLPSCETLNKIGKALDVEFPKEIRKPKERTKKSCNEICSFMLETRESRGFSQRNTAKMMNISAAQLCRIESGVFRPTSKTLEKFAEVFDLDIVSLLKMAEYGKPVISKYLNERKEKINNAIINSDFLDNEIEVVINFAELYHNSKNEEKEFMKNFTSKYQKLSEKEKNILKIILS